MDRMILKNDFTIQEVSDRLGLPKSTLRFWERSLGNYLMPERTAGGQRRYTQKLVIRYEQVREMRSAGHSLKDIKNRIELSADHGMNIQINDHFMKIADHIGDIVSTELYQLLLKEFSRDSKIVGKAKTGRHCP